MLLHPDREAELHYEYIAKQEKLYALAQELNLDWDDLSPIQLKCLERELNDRFYSDREP